MNLNIFKNTSPSTFIAKIGNWTNCDDDDDDDEAASGSSPWRPQRDA